MWSVVILSPTLRISSQSRFSSGAFPTGIKLQALHIHDNDQHYDSHQIPFSMNIDFDAVVKALQDINYKGWFTLEADRYLSAYNADTVMEGIRKLADSAKVLAEKFEG